MDPCLFCSTRIGARVIAIMDFFLSIVFLLLCSLALIFLNVFPEETQTWFANGEGMSVVLKEFMDLGKVYEIADAVSVGGLIYSIQKLALACVLIVAAFQERAKLVRIWIVYTLLLTVLSVLIFLSLLVAGVILPWSIPFFVAGFLCREYSIWVSYAFLRSLQSHSAESFLIQIPTTSSRGSMKVVCKL